MQGGSLLFGRAPAISPLAGLESGSTPAAPRETLVSTTTWRPEPRATVPQPVRVPATRSNGANEPHQPVEAPTAQEAGAALSTTGTSAGRLSPGCQTDSS